MSAAKRLYRELTRPRGSPLWTAVLRGTGVISAVAIVCSARWPDIGVLAGFACITILLNGPLSPVLPAAYEPVLMTMGRLYPPLLVAVIGIAGILFVELLNFHLYRCALMHARLRGVVQSRPVRFTLALFQKAPFFCIWLCAWSPLPYWVVRILAPVAGYPVRRYLLATLLGRGPRLWFFAALGAVVPLSTSLLLGVTAGTVLLGVLGWVISRAVSSRRTGRALVRARMTGAELPRTR